MAQSRYLTILAIIGFCGTLSESFEIKHYQLDSARLVETTEQNFALTSPAFLPRGWKTVSVNGDKVTITKSICQTSELELSKMSSLDLAIVMGARSELLQAERFGNARKVPYLVQTFNGNNLESRGLEQTIYSSESPRIVGTDQNNYSIEGLRGSMNIIRTFSNYAETTFVYGNKQVQMKPLSCLSIEENKFILEVKYHFERISKTLKDKTLLQELEKTKREKKDVQREEELKIKKIYEDFLIQKQKDRIA